VQGVGPEAILSFYGDSRDGGLRRHEGIDIFSPRGNPILAASDSVVYRVGERDRGGNIVTLYDEKRDLLLYYAHLDEQLVRQGQRVAAGDPIGTNGNTGNAITTPPHLHIGLYQGGWRRDVDPWNYFVDPPLIEPPEPENESLIGQWFTVPTAVEFLAGPPVPTVLPRFINYNRDAEMRQPPVQPADERVSRTVELSAGTAVQVLGVSWQTLRVMTADGTSGVIPTSAVSTPAVPPRTIAEARIAADPATGDAIAELQSGDTVSVLGTGRNGESVVLLQSGRVAVTGRLE
jgi:hypothetical protein